MTNLVLANLASPENPGDFAILKGSLKLLRENYENPRITLVTRRFSERAAYQELGCDVIPSYPNAEHTATDSKWKKIAALPKALAENRLEPAVRQADAVYLIGGGYFYSYKRTFPGLTYLSHYMPVKFAARYQKPVIVLPQSYGPFHSWAAQRIFDEVVRKSSVLFYREEISGAWLDEHYEDQRRRFVFMPDLALMLEPADLGISGLEQEARQARVGVTVRPWKAGGVDQDRYLEILAEVLLRLHRKYGLKIRIIVQVMCSTRYESDEFVSEKLYRLLEKSIKAENLEFKLERPFFSLPVLCRLYAECDFLIGMRLHSVLLSFLTGRPALAVGYQHKSEGILRSLSLESLFMSGFDRTAREQLMEGSEDLIQNSEGWKRRIWNSLVWARQEIRTVFKREKERI